MKQKKHVVIVVPAYNNGRTLGNTLKGIPNLPGFEKSLLVVDDASSDDTFTVAHKFTPHVIRHAHNWGVGAATKMAFQQVLTRESLKNADYLIKFDGDGQHDPNYLPKVLENLESGADLVVCSRFHQKSKPVHTPTNRVLLNEVFAEICSRVTGWRLSDARSGFMGMKFEFVQPILDTLCVKGYGIPMNILLGLWKHKPEARVESIAHPAIYGGETLTHEHRKRYRKDGESITEIKARFAEAWNAFDQIANAIGISSDCYHCRVDEAVYSLDQGILSPLSQYTTAAS